MTRKSWTLVLAVGAAFTHSLHAQLVFAFNYLDTNAGFSDATLGTSRRNALQSAANALAGYFTGYNVSITLEVSSNNADSATLASAGSGLLSGDAGFYRTIVQNKILTGVDVNGATADGTVNYNFFHNWDLSDAVAANAYDFKSTAMHELLHAMGFSGEITKTGQGALGSVSGQPDKFAVFDQFVTTSTGAKLIRNDFSYDTTLTLAPLTGNPGMYFDGPNAKAANGGNRVPLFSPNPWSDGSSGSHTDDTTFTGANALMMNSATATGPGLRTLSGIEQGMLKDLGYAVVPEPGTYTLFAAMGLAGFAVARRWRSAARA